MRQLSAAAASASRVGNTRANSGPALAGPDAESPSSVLVMSSAKGSALSSHLLGKVAGRYLRLLEPTNCHLYLLHADVVFIAAGVFHTPHMGYLVHARMAFYRALWVAWAV